MPQPERLSTSPTQRESDIRALRAAAQGGERDFAEQMLDGAQLGGAELVAASFARTSLRGADLSNALLREANFEGADLRESNLSGATLEGANLRGAHGSGCSFLGSKLTGACLEDSRLTTAGFRDADLTEMVASGAELSGADFTGASARRANLARANLRGATFSAALLDGANFTSADLRGAQLDDAELGYADLSGADLSGASFSRANLAGARLGDGEPPYAADHRNVEQHASQHQSLLLSLLGLCAYVLVSVATTTDAQLALNRSLVRLPIIDAELPLQLFFVGAAGIVFLASVYLGLEQSRLFYALGRLPRVFPDSAHSSERAHPSIVVVAFAHWFARPTRMRRAEEPLREALTRSTSSWPLELSVFLLIWGLAPLTLGALLLRFLTSQRDGQSYLLWALFAASIAVSFKGYLNARVARGQRHGRSIGIATVLLGTLLLATLPGVLRGIHDFHVVAPRAQLSTVEGDHVQGADLERATLEKADLRMANLQQAVLRQAQLGGARLGGASLAGASAEFAVLDGAELPLADLTKTFLWGAHLSRANLEGIRGRGVDLRHANLRDVRARGADLRAALAEKARFDGANLVEAALAGISAGQATFEGAHLDGANLAGALLQGANLRGAGLAKTNLVGADLTHADLTGASDLLAAQLCTAVGWRSALLPGDTVEETQPPFRIVEPGLLRDLAERRCPDSNTLKK